MSDFSDKSDTFEFDPIKDNKPRLDRRESDPYSNARQNVSPTRREEKPNYTLVYVAIALAVLLIITVVLTIFVVGRDSQEPLSPENGEVIIEEEDPEEDPEEEQEIILECTVTFYSDSVIKQGDSYTVLADLYDGELYKFDNRKLTINAETDIRENGGKRISKDALIYLIEDMAGESLAFSAEIREEDNVVLSVTFDGSITQEEPPLEEEPPAEEPPLEEEPPKEDDGEVILPGEPAVDGI